MKERERENVREKVRKKLVRDIREKQEKVRHEGHRREEKDREKKGLKNELNLEGKTEKDIMC